MLKEFIAHIQKTTQPLIHEVEGATFVINAEGEYQEMLPTIFHPDTLSLNSLDALVKLVKTEASEMDTPLYITIPDHMTVRCFGQPSADERYFRQVYYEAHATDVPGWGEKNTLGFEEAQIALRTRFQETQDTLYTMKLVSDISLGAKVIYNDNGIATTITTQKGVALQTNEQIRPIVKGGGAAGEHLPDPGQRPRHLLHRSRWRNVETVCPGDYQEVPGGAAAAGGQ